MPKISVIMPSYNHERFVAHAIRSVLDQGFLDDWELIIVDDASSDGTVAEIKKFDDPRIRLIVFENNQGGSVVANRCLSEAKGQYIAVLNSDDIFMPGKLEAQNRYLDEHPECGAVFSYVILIDEQGVRIGEHPLLGRFNEPGTDRFDMLNHFFYKANRLCHPTAMIRKSVFDDIGPYDVRMAQLPDFDQWVRMCLKHEIHIMEEALVEYRIRDSSLSGSGASPQNLARFPWEQSIVLSHYTEIGDFDELCRIFPLAERYRAHHDAVPGRIEVS